jgi:hypothetical protein
MGQTRNINVLTDERTEVETINTGNITFVKRSAFIVTFVRAGAQVFHQSDCRAQQRIIDPGIPAFEWL